jgi:carboxymethylenebutenolidase
MIEKQIDIATTAGRMGTFICYPERGGPHPVILFLMDAPGIREELRDMARRLATVGYYVMLPNLYYRGGVGEVEVVPGEAREAWLERIFALMDGLTIAGVMDDTRALIAVADGDDAAGKGPMGAVGYCMSGQYAITAAADFPDRVTAVASIYGTRLVTDQPDSAHLAIRRMKADLYLACAELDHYVPLDLLGPVGDSIRDAGIKAEVEIYPAVDHGFAFPQRATFDKASAERHWERLFALFRQLNR